MRVLLTSLIGWLLVFGAKLPFSIEFGPEGECCGGCVQSVGNASCCQTGTESSSFVECPCGDHGPESPALGLEFWVDVPPEALRTDRPLLGTTWSPERMRSRTPSPETPPPRAA